LSPEAPARGIEDFLHFTFKLVEVFVFGFIGGLLIILVCGLIVTIFTQKKNPEMPI